ncbi:hypothetical protein GF382_02435 [Candidatus Falkowbacteria bacterium]|nr:hypothetical protein [Candidatus Falkowbacteria bacterium]
MSRKNFYALSLRCNRTVLPATSACGRERVRAARRACRGKTFMHYLYVLQSFKNERIYTGIAEDLKRRLEDHNKGKTRSTKAFRPWKVIYYEAHRNKVLAERAEIFYKTSQGRRQLRKKLFL